MDGRLLACRFLSVFIFYFIAMYAGIYFVIHPEVLIAFYQSFLKEKIIVGHMIAVLILANLILFLSIVDIVLVYVRYNRRNHDYEEILDL